MPSNAVRAIASKWRTVLNYTFGTEPRHENALFSLSSAALGVK